MSYTLKTHQISVKDPATGQYSGVDILAEQTEQGLIAELQAEGTTQVNRIGQAAVDVQAAVDKAESDAAGIISETQQSINTLEREKNTIAATVASMAELGTDATLSTPGMAADAAAVGELNRQLSDETTANAATKAPVILETASGAIASFDDGADSMPIRKIVATIEPVQAGSGDASPDNVRPISGWTGCIFNKAGVNLANPSNIISSLVGDGAKFRSSGVYKTLYVPVKHNTNYALYHLVGRSKGSYWGFCDSIPAIDVSTYDAMVTTNQRNITKNSGLHNYMFFCMETSETPETEKLQFSFGTTATSYTPFVGHVQLPINWQTEVGTIYGGTITLNEDGSADVVANTTIVDLGDYPFSQYNNTNHCWTGQIHPMSFVINNNPVVCCEEYKVLRPQSILNSGQNLAIWAYDSEINARLIIRNDSFIGESGAYDIDALNNSLTGVHMCCLMKMPITCHFDNIGQLKTFLGINNVWIDSGAITECDYPADTKLFLTARDEEITGNIAPIENGPTASKAYAQGAYFWHHTKFCKALTAIASGATFTLGTNYQETTVAAELLAAQN